LIQIFKYLLRNNFLLVLNQKTYNYEMLFGYLVVRVQKTLFDFIDEDDDLKENQKIKIN
jgi:hypothetical protein